MNSKDVRASLLHPTRKEKYDGRICVLSFLLLAVVIVLYHNFSIDESLNEIGVGKDVWVTGHGYASKDSSIAEDDKKAKQSKPSGMEWIEGMGWGTKDGWLDEEQKIAKKEYSSWKNLGSRERLVS